MVAWLALVLAGAPPSSAPVVDRSVDPIVAAPTSATDDAAAPVVIVGVAPTLGLAEDDVRAVLSSHLAGTGLALEVTTLSTDDARAPESWARGVDVPGLRAAFWLTPEGADAVRLQLWLPGDAGAWGRALPSGDDGDALLESIGVMVRSMATSIEPTARPVAPPPPVVVAPPSPAPQATAPPRTRARIDASLGYVGGNVTGSIPWHSGVGLRVHAILPRGATPMLGVAWAPPVGGPDDPPTTLTRVAIDLGLAATLRRDARVQPIVGGAAVVEAVGWRVRDVAEGRGWAARFGLAAVAGLDVSVSRRVGLLLLGRADAWVANATLVLEGPSGRSTLLRAHAVGGLVWAGLRVRLRGSFFHPNHARTRHRGR